MSGWNQRTKARRERADTTAVTDGPALAVASPWSAIDVGLCWRQRHPTATAAVAPVFPLDLLPQPWRDWAGDAARLAGAPVDYVAQALLASVAGLGGRRVVVIPTPGWQEPLRLWLAAVGAPSTGKSPALASVRRLLWTLEDASPGDGSAPPRRIVLRDGAVRAPRRRACAQDPRGMVLWRDDAAALPGAARPARRSVRQLEPYGAQHRGHARARRRGERRCGRTDRRRGALPLRLAAAACPSVRSPGAASCRAMRLLEPLAACCTPSTRSRRRTACSSTRPPRARSMPSGRGCMRRRGRPTGSRRRGWARAAARWPASPAPSR